MTAIREQKPIKIPETIFWTKAGTNIPVEFSVNLVDDRKSTLEAVVTFQDITNRLEERERVEKLIDTAPAAMLIVNNKHRIEMFNQETTKLLGYSDEELNGLDARKLIPPEVAKDYANYIDDFWQNPRRISSVEAGFEARAIKKSGEIVEVEDIHTPVTIDKEVKGIVLLRDVTIENKAKQTLVKAKEMADEASKAKSDFLANMRHEIRTPMNAIIGMSDLAMQHVKDNKARNYIGKVNRAAESLLGIINDILDFSKIEAGKLTLEAVDFHLEDVLADFSNLVGLKAHDKGLELLFDVKQNVTRTLVGDPLRLNQILLNLGSNATKFTEEGEIVIAVSQVEQKIAKLNCSLM